MKVSLISSVDKEHEFFGYFYNGQLINNVGEALRRSGFDFEVIRINSAERFDNQHLDGIELVWPNIYTFHDIDSNEEVWLAELLDERNVPYIGSSRIALESVLEKGTCQSILNDAGVSVPRFVLLSEDNVDEVAPTLEEQLVYPVIVKPVNQFGSRGITEEAIKTDLDSTIARARQMFKEYDEPVIVEEYLSGRELTIGVIGSSSNIFVVSTYLNFLNGHHYPIFNREIRLKGCHAPELEMELVRNQPDLLALESLAVKVYDALGIRDFTRFDCRYDGEGNLKVFDVNGMPGLDVNSSSSTVQIYKRFPNLPQQEVYDAIVNSIVLSAANRYGLQVPDTAKNENLFQMVS